MMNRKKMSKKLAALVLAAGMMFGTSTTAFAFVDPAAETEVTTEASTEETTKTEATTEAAEATTNEKKEEPKTADGSAFTVPGNAEVQDDVTDDSSKEFLTIRTANNQTFYVVIDRATTTENVYMLSNIDENDLQEFLTDGEKKTATGSAEVVLDEQQVTTTPAIDTAKEEKETKPSGNKWAWIGLGGVAALGLAGYYYFKIYKPKKEEEDEDNQNLELDDGLDTINEDEEQENDVELVDLDDVADEEEFEDEDEEE